VHVTVLTHSACFLNYEFTFSQQKDLPSTEGRMTVNDVKQAVMASINLHFLESGILDFLILQGWQSYLNLG
jgi:hypothetical protein